MAIAFVGLMAFMLLCENTNAKKNKVNCESVKSGIGYFVYMMEEVPMFENLDAKSLSLVKKNYQTAVTQVMSEQYFSDSDLSEDPFNLKTEDVITTKMKGFSYDFDGKKLTQTALSKNLGYVFTFILYTVPFGPKEEKGMLDTEELPSIELKGPEGNYRAYNFISVRCFIYEPGAKKPIAKTKEKQYSYREWFMKKYPEFFSGESEELPSGVDFNSGSQYQVFIKESLIEIMKTSPELVHLKTCTEKKP
jgi:hypothetical protein